MEIEKKWMARTTSLLLYITNIKVFLCFSLIKLLHVPSEMNIEQGHVSSYMFIPGHHSEKGSPKYTWACNQILLGSSFASPSGGQPFRNQVSIEHYLKVCAGKPDLYPCQSSQVFLLTICAVEWRFAPTSPWFPSTLWQSATDDHSLVNHLVWKMGLNWNIECTVMENISQ